MNEPREKKGGNLYDPHPFMIDSGTFWRCRHGTTGFGKHGWEGCAECAKEDHAAYRKWCDADRAAMSFEDAIRDLSERMAAGLPAQASEQMRDLAKAALNSRDDRSIEEWAKALVDSVHARDGT